MYDKFQGLSKYYCRFCFRVFLGAIDIREKWIIIANWLYIGIGLPKFLIDILFRAAFFKVAPFTNQYCHNRENNKLDNALKNAYAVEPRPMLIVIEEV